jgi:hypothetical protein
MAPNDLRLSCEGVRQQPHSLAVQYTVRLLPQLRPRQLQARVMQRGQVRSTLAIPHRDTHSNELETPLQIPFRE